MIEHQILIHVNAESHGGTETHVYHLCKLLRSRGNSVVVVGLRKLELNSLWRHELEQLGVKFMLPPKLRWSAQPLVMVFALLRLLVTLKPRSFDCVVGEGRGAAFLSLRWFLKKDGILVWHEHCAGVGVGSASYDDVPTDSTPLRLPARMLRAGRMVDGIIVGSHLAKENLLRVQGIKRPVCVIPPLDFIQATRAECSEFDRSKEPLKVVVLGRLARGKGIPELLEAWQEAQVGSAELHFYGPNSQWAEQFLADWTRVSGVYFHGPIEPAEVPLMARIASFGVIPSASEGFGLAAFELMACGVPCVITDTGAAREFSEQNPDCIVCSMSISGLRDGIERMATLVREGRVSRMRLRTLWSERFSFDAIADKHAGALTCKSFWHQTVS